jgi:thiosulfate dehydrogenase [quinone] large subunit
MSSYLSPVKRFEVENPAILQRLCTSTRWAWVWLPLRLYLGWIWVRAGWERISDLAWMQTGEAVQQYWLSVLATSTESPSYIVNTEWYQGFVRLLLEGGHYAWFGRLIVFTEIAIGILLLLGAFTGVAAAIAAFLNWNFIMAGTASANGWLLPLALLLVLAWQVAGNVGLDYWLLPFLGTPWGRWKKYLSRG